MTEAEWQTCSEPDVMLSVLDQRGSASERKLWLFIANCLRRRSTVTAMERPGELIDLTEQFADGLIDRETLWDARRRYHYGDTLLWVLLSASAMRAAQEGSLHCATDIAHDNPIYHSLDATQDERHKRWEECLWRERGAQAELLRELFGPMAALAIEVSDSWLAWSNRCVVRLGQAIYEERAFERMPILADALEDAGCDNTDILNHCRQPGVHVRGCWVVDLLLGKS